MTSEKAPERIWAIDDLYVDEETEGLIEYVHADLLAAKDARIAELETENQRIKSDRQWIVGFNDGFEQALKQAADVARPAEIDESTDYSRGYVHGQRHASNAIAALSREGE